CAAAHSDLTCTKVQIRPILGGDHTTVSVHQSILSNIPGGWRWARLPNSRTFVCAAGGLRNGNSTATYTDLALGRRAFLFQFRFAPAAHRAREGDDAGGISGRFALLLGRVDLPAHISDAPGAPFHS